MATVNAGQASGTSTATRPYTSHTGLPAAAGAAAQPAPTGGPPMTSAAAGTAAATGWAHIPSMSPAETWQVIWPHVEVSVYGAPVTRYQGELVPGTVYASEKEQRRTLARLGALRAVTAYSGTTALRAAIAAALAADLTAATRRLTEQGITIPATAAPVPSITIGGQYYAGPAT